jgi:hypothetical protein
VLGPCQRLASTVAAAAEAEELPEPALTLAPLSLLVIIIDALDECK